MVFFLINKGSLSIDNSIVLNKLSRDCSDILIIGPDAVIDIAERDLDSPIDLVIDAVGSGQCVYRENGVEKRICFVSSVKDLDRSISGLDADVIVVIHNEVVHDAINISSLHSKLSIVGAGVVTIPACRISFGRLEKTPVRIIGDADIDGVLFRIPNSPLNTVIIDKLYIDTNGRSLLSVESDIMNRVHIKEVCIGSVSSNPVFLRSILASQELSLDGVKVLVSNNSRALLDCCLFDYRYVGGQVSLLCNNLEIDVPVGTAIIDLMRIEEHNINGKSVYIDERGLICGSGCTVGTDLIMPCIGDGAAYINPIEGRDTVISYVMETESSNMYSLWHIYIDGQRHGSVYKLYNMLDPLAISLWTSSIVLVNDTLDNPVQCYISGDTYFLFSGDTEEAIRGILHKVIRTSPVQMSSDKGGYAISIAGSGAIQMAGAISIPEEILFVDVVFEDVSILDVSKIILNSGSDIHIQMGSGAVCIFNDANSGKRTLMAIDQAAFDDACSFHHEWILIENIHWKRSLELIPHVYSRLFGLQGNVAADLLSGGRIHINEPNVYSILCPKLINMEAPHLICTNVDVMLGSGLDLEGQLRLIFRGDEDSVLDMSLLENTMNIQVDLHEKMLGEVSIKDFYNTWVYEEIVDPENKEDFLYVSDIAELRDAVNSTNFIKNIIITKNIHTSKIPICRFDHNFWCKPKTQSYTCSKQSITLHIEIIDRSVGEGELFCDSDTDPLFIIQSGVMLNLYGAIHAPLLVKTDTGVHGYKIDISEMYSDIQEIRLELYGNGQIEIRGEGCGNIAIVDNQKDLLARLSNDATDIILLSRNIFFNNSIQPLVLLKNKVIAGMVDLYVADRDYSICLNKERRPIIDVSAIDASMLYVINKLTLSKMEVSYNACPWVYAYTNGCCVLDDIILSPTCEQSCLLRYGGLSAEDITNINLSIKNVFARPSSPWSTEHTIFVDISYTDIAIIDIIDNTDAGSPDCDLFTIGAGDMAIVRYALNNADRNRGSKLCLNDVKYCSIDISNGKLVPVKLANSLSGARVLACQNNNEIAYWYRADSMDNFLHEVSHGRDVFVYGQSNVHMKEDWLCDMNVLFGVDSGRYVVGNGGIDLEIAETSSIEIYCDDHIVWSIVGDTERQISFAHGCCRLVSPDELLISVKSSGVLVDLTNLVIEGSVSFLIQSLGTIIMPDGHRILVSNQCNTDLSDIIGGDILDASLVISGDVLISKSISIQKDISIGTNYLSEDHVISIATVYDELCLRDTSKQTWFLLNATGDTGDEIVVCHLNGAFNIVMSPGSSLFLSSHDIGYYHMVLDQLHLIGNNVEFQNDQLQEVVFSVGNHDCFYFGARVATVERLAERYDHIEWRFIDDIYLDATVLSDRECELGMLNGLVVPLELMCGEGLLRVSDDNLFPAMLQVSAYAPMGFVSSLMLKNVYVHIEDNFLFVPEGRQQISLELHDVILASQSSFFINGSPNKIIMKRYRDGELLENVLYLKNKIFALEELFNDFCNCMNKIIVSNSACLTLSSTVDFDHAVSINNSYVVGGNVIGFCSSDSQSTDIKSQMSLKSSDAQLCLQGHDMVISNMRIGANTLKNSMFICEGNEGSSKYHFYNLDVDSGWMYDYFINNLEAASEIVLSDVKIDTRIAAVHIVHGIHSIELDNVHIRYSTALPKLGYVFIDNAKDCSISIKLNRPADSSVHIINYCGDVDAHVSILGGNNFSKVGVLYEDLKKGANLYISTKNDTWCIGPTRMDLESDIANKFITFCTSSVEINDTIVVPSDKWLIMSEPCAVKDILMLDGQSTELLVVSAKHKLYPIGAQIIRHTGTKPLFKLYGGAQLKLCGSIDTTADLCELSGNCCIDISRLCFVEPISISCFSYDMLLRCHDALMVLSKSWAITDTDLLLIKKVYFGGFVKVESPIRIVNDIVIDTVDILQPISLQDVYGNQGQMVCNIDEPHSVAEVFQTSQDLFIVEQPGKSVELQGRILFSYDEALACPNTVRVVPAAINTHIKIEHLHASGYLLINLENNKSYVTSFDGVKIFPASNIIELTKWCEQGCDVDILLTRPITMAKTCTIPDSVSVSIYGKDRYEKDLGELVLAVRCPIYKNISPTIFTTGKNVAFKISDNSLMRVKGVSFEFLSVYTDGCDIVIADNANDYILDFTNSTMSPEHKFSFIGQGRVLFDKGLFNIEESQRTIKKVCEILDM